MFAYYFQLNSKYGISLHRATHLFNDLADKNYHKVERYLYHICGMRDTAIAEFKWYWLMHIAEVITRDDFWELYMDMNASNLQSTFEMCTILRLPHTEPLYDCRRFVPTNGSILPAHHHSFILHQRRHGKQRAAGSLSTRTSIAWIMPENNTCWN